jgi:hypothetical protein
VPDLSLLDAYVNADSTRARDVSALHAGDAWCALPPMEQPDDGIGSAARSKLAMIGTLP